MKMAIFALTLLFTFSYLPHSFAQTAEVNTAKEAIQGMSGLLESLDELKSQQEVTETLSKLGKAAKSFALAGAAFDIGLALFGGEEENIQLLNEIKNMLTEVQQSLKNLEGTVEASADRVIDNVNYSSAKSQVFGSTANIEVCLSLVNNLLNSKTAASREATKTQIRNSTTLFVRLRNDFVQIRKSIHKEADSEDILDAVIARSYGDYSVVNELSKRLLGAAISSVYALNMYYAIVYEEDPSQVAAHRELIFNDFAGDIDLLQRGVERALTNCLHFNTVKKHAKAGVNQVVDKYSGESDKKQICKKIKQDLIKKWPESTVIVVAMNKKGDQYSFFHNNFNDHNVPAVQIPWESNALKGVVLVISSPEFLNSGAAYDQYMRNNRDRRFVSGKFDALWEATRIYRDYWRDKNLHRYASDGGSNKPFAKMPFLFVGEIISKKNGGAPNSHQISVGPFINSRSGYQGHSDYLRIGTMIFPSQYRTAYEMGIYKL